jgi:hypothetical protein
MPDRKLDLAVRKLSPFLNDWHEPTLGRLVDDLAGFATSRIEGQPEQLLIRVGHFIGQITRTRTHAGTPTLVNRRTQTSDHLTKKLQ